jgi:hypothetical protein
LRSTKEKIERAVLKATIEANSHALWPIFENYEVERVNGELFISAVIQPMSSALEETYPEWLRAELWVKRYYAPLRDYPDQFVRFARLLARSNPQTEDEKLEMVLRWVHDYGILGVEGIDTVADRKRRGGCRERVETFVAEAKRAAFVLDAFESANSGDLDKMRHCVQTHWVEEIATWLPDKIKATLEGNVRRIVGEYVKDDCYRILSDIPGDFSQYWGFRSQLGAMYLEVMFYILEPEMIRWCKAPDCKNIMTFEAGTSPESSRKGARGKYRTRSDKVFCSKACAERTQNRRKMASRAATS